MKKNNKKIFLAIALIFILLSSQYKLILKKADADTKQNVSNTSTINADEFYKAVPEGVAPTKIYVYGIDLVEYYAIKDTSLIKDLGMNFWTTNLGLDSNNYTQRLYFTTKPISEELAAKYELYKYFIYLDEMQAPLFRVYEHIEGHPSYYYVTNNPNEISDEIVPIVDPNSETIVAYDINTREEYLVSEIEAEEIRKGNRPGQVVYGPFDRDFAYENSSPEPEFMNMINSLFVEHYRNADGPEVEEFFKLFKKIYNSRA